MQIPGHPDGPHVDASGWPADEPFWPAFLLHFGSARSALDAFDVDLADLDAYLDRFADPSRWPVFPLPVGDGTLYVIGCNLPTDVGISYVLDEDALAVLGRHPYTGQGVPLALLPESPEQRLLALPAAGDDLEPQDATRLVADALAAVGAVGAVEALADELLEHRAWLLN